MQQWVCVLSAFTDQRFVPGMQPIWNKVRNHLRGGWGPVQHCQAWLHSAIQAACQPGTGGSFPCSSTIMYNTHYHRNEAAGAQTRTSIQSPTSFPTTNANCVSKWKEDPKESTADSSPYPYLLPASHEEIQLVLWVRPQICRNKWI